jgi:hypothetical protein
VQNAYDSLSAGQFTVTKYNDFVSFSGESMVFTSASVLSTNYKTIGFIVTANNTAATGGTYTLTAFTQTTAAIAYNATAATVQTELNALSNVASRGNCTVSGELATGFAITFTNAAMTTSGASLTPTGSASVVSVIDGGIGRIHRATFSNPTSFRDIYIASHGIVFGDTLYIRATAGPAYYAGITAFSVPDANTIRFTVSPSDAWAAVVAIDECGKRTRYHYEAGVASIRAKNISSFYLPGITTGISTPDDIPIPVNQGDSTSLLLAIFAGTGTLNYSVGQLERWNDWPILRLTKTTIAVADIS